MSFKTILLAGLTAAAFALPAFAGDIMIHDPYARVSAKMSASGAAFMVIMNKGNEVDQLIAASSDVAEKVELHTHKENDQGVMQMLHVKEGFAIPANGEHALARGGDHVMFLGLKQSLADGDVVDVTLTFEKAGDVQVQIPVDLKRKPKHGKTMDHSTMDHSKSDG